MKILHVITGMQKAAGTTTFVENVVVGLKALGHDAEIAMAESGFVQCDVIHIHGLWSALLHAASQFAKANDIPVVWSTHGMTAPWSMRHKWWKKLPAWWLYQKWDLNRAASIHCTTDQEVVWNNALGFGNCFIAPLGTNEISNHVDHVEHLCKTLLFVGRIYPVTGLVNLIKAWKLVLDSACSTRFDMCWKLRIVGPDQAGHQAELEALVRELSLCGSVEFVGPKYGAELNAEYDNCDCLVLPSFTENFGATVVDALAHGKPCIASTFTPWRELTERDCGWWVANAPKPLADAILKMVSLDDAACCAMGERGRKLVEEKYTWSAVVKKMVDKYEEVVNG